MKSQVIDVLMVVVFIIVSVVFFGFQLGSTEEEVFQSTFWLPENNRLYTSSKEFFSEIDRGSDSVREWHGHQSLEFFKQEVAKLAPNEQVNVCLEEDRVIYLVDLGDSKGIATYGYEEPLPVMAKILDFKYLGGENVEWKIGRNWVLIVMSSLVCGAFGVVGLWMFLSIIFVAAKYILYLATQVRKRYFVSA